LTLEIPSALRVEPGKLPTALPRTVEEIAPPLYPSEPEPGPAETTTLFLTVDVEDSYFDRPILMTGDGIGREFGVYGILDALDAHEMKGTFFVNVYEKDRQPAGVVEGVVRDIAGRGHEVGLHSHPSWSLDFYRRPLFRLSKAAQVDVLRWGADLIAEWTGEAPTSFRGGGYAVNDDTFAALEEVGIAIDSSCFFPSANNHNTRHTVNAIGESSGRIEVPVTTVLRANGNGGLEARKLDIDWLSVDQLGEALDSLIDHRVPFATFMMHSFSFIEKRTRMPDDPPSPAARFVSKVDSDRYVEVYGPKAPVREAFAAFLNQVAKEKSLEVRTLRDALPDLSHTSPFPDVTPVVARPDLAISPSK
jgi:peptidoglycan/xylan/chitin deacetylase (PgdA/CDA1 family)